MSASLKGKDQGQCCKSKCEEGTRSDQIKIKIWGRHLVRPNQNKIEIKIWGRHLVRPGSATEPGGAEGEGRKEEPLGEWCTTCGVDCGQFECFAYFLLKCLGLRAVFVMWCCNWRSDKGLRWRTVGDKFGRLTIIWFGVGSLTLSWWCWCLLLTSLPGTLPLPFECSVFESLFGSGEERGL